MAIPDFQSFFRPLLEYAADGNEKNIRQAIVFLADRFGLSNDERAELLSSGKQTVLANRVHWALTYLDKAEALRTTRRSHFVMTDRGRDLLTRFPGRITKRELMQFPEFRAFATKTAEHSGTAAVEQTDTGNAPPNQLQRTQSTRPKLRL